MRMKWMTIAVVALLAMPAGAEAHGTGGEAPNAAKFCKQLRAELGKSQHGKCVSVTRYEMTPLLEQAVSECKTQGQVTQAGRPEHTPGDDKGERGKLNRDERAAFRACVKEKMQVQLTELKTRFAAAVEQCKTEREADPVAFREHYGKGHGSRRALARCVNEHVREEPTTL